MTEQNAEEIMRQAQEPACPETDSAPCGAEEQAQRPACPETDSAPCGAEEQAQRPACPETDSADSRIEEQPEEQPEAETDETEETAAEAAACKLTEDCEPPRTVIRSDVMLYVLVALGALVLTVLVSYAFVSRGGNILFAEALLLLLFIAVTVVLYRTRLVVYRYSLTDRMLTVERVVGKKVTPELGVHLSSIRYVKPYSEVPLEELGNLEQFFHGKKKEAWGVGYRAAGLKRTLLLSPGEQFRKELVLRWKAAKK